MSAPAYIWHVTLQTGHSRQSERVEIDDHIIDLLEPLLAADGEVQVPQVAERTMRITRSGRMLLATVMAGAAPICTIAVAGRSRGANRLWQIINEEGLMGRGASSTHPADPPRAPWCAARIEVGLPQHMSDTEWLGDLERCLAWTWIERYCR